MKYAWKDIKNIVPKILGKFSKTRSLALDLYFSSLKLNFSQYDNFYSAVSLDISSWIIEKLPETCAIHRYEDGISSYLPIDIESYEKDIFLFEPLLSNCPADKLRKINKISTSDETTSEIVRKLCSGLNFKLPPVLIVDQSWGANAVISSHPSKEQRAAWERRLALIDLVLEKEGKERCGILVHPKAKEQEIKALKNIFGESLILDLGGIPLEVFLLNSRDFPEKFYTIASSAAFYWKIACDCDAKSKIIFLIKDFQFNDFVLNNTPKIFEKLKEMYPKQVEISESLLS